MFAKFFAPASAKPVVQLPKLSTANATELAAKAKPSPEGQSLVQPSMSSSEYVHALEQNKQSMDAVNALAHGMPERDSVWWASQSAQKVADKLNPEEKAATGAAEAWVKNPNPDTKAAAAEAAAKTDFKGPGGWAAQAAAWSQESAAPAATAATPAAAPAQHALTASAVAGAVLLASGLVSRPAMGPPQKPDLQSPPAPVAKEQAPAAEQPVPPPVDQAKLAPQLQPFIALGKDIASGKNTWA